MFIKQCYDIHVKFVLRISRNKLLFSLLWLVRLYRTIHQSFSRGNAGLNDILNIFQQQRDQSIPKAKRLILCPTKCFFFTQKSENGCSLQKQGKIKKATNHSTKLKSKEILQVRMYDFGHICHLMIDIERCCVSCYWYFILEYPSAH